MRKYLALLCFVFVLGLLPAAAQDAATPMVAVRDQISLDGHVIIDSVVSSGPGWLVIHTDNNGAPGPIAGVAPVAAGMTSNLRIPVYNTDVAPTPTLFAMLHTDDGEVGVYEFGQVEGADAPVSVDGQVVTPAFQFASIFGLDQFIGDDNLLTISSVTIGVPGFLVIHAGDADRFGPVLAQTAIAAGTSANVSVEIPADGRTEVLWPMLHVDTGEVGVYEFGQVEGADGPVIVGGTIATTPIFTVPHVRAASQIVFHADNWPAMGDMTAEMAPSVTAASVFSSGPGFLVIHADNAGAPGPVLGFTAVPDGVTQNVTVELSGDITPVVWPMLHVDTGVVGTYEFGQVEGADGPVRVFDQVLTFPISIAPSMQFAAQPVAEDGTITVAEVLIDAEGWLVIHSSQDGAPGPVLGQTRVGAGLNRNVRVTIDAAAAGEQVFPMLHYDTGVSGVYEFGQVEGADGPVVFGGNVVVAPMTIEAGS